MISCNVNLPFGHELLGIFDTRVGCAESQWQIWIGIDPWNEQKLLQVTTTLGCHVRMLTNSNAVLMCRRTQILLTYQEKRQKKQRPLSPNGLSNLQCGCFGHGFCA